jgi:hypothetical protein
MIELGLTMSLTSTLAPDTRLAPVRAAEALS